ncbi:MAG: 3-dehydroquinate synthase [Candidatus Peribacteraceae bacterium]|nr:3-dehydroquinate synthase [Candidatus Peribacteraceae bacterium]
MTIIHLTPPKKDRPSHDIIVGSGESKHIAELIALLGSFDAVVILYDANVANIAQAIAHKIPRAKCLEVPHGDSSKLLSQIEKITQKMLAFGCTRNTMLMNIGGGMITDLGGFIASIFMRGIPFIHVPTSMLGMIDAAIGGKTGVNAAGTKNILGTVNFPKAVIVDTDFLRDLPVGLLAEGLVEVVKVAAMRDKNFFVWLEKNLAGVMKKEEETLIHCVTSAIALKAKTVEEDDSDTLVRLYLNFGHTVAHAVEALSHYSLSHGKAVSIGMVAEMTMAGFSDRDRVQALLQQLDMPMTIPSEFKKDDVWNLMKNDKKNTKGDVRIAVPKNLGSGEIRSITKEDFDSLFVQK